jgi:hypothetical protein
LEKVKLKRQDVPEAGQVDQELPEVIGVGATAALTVPSPETHLRILRIAPELFDSTNATSLPSSESTGEL